MTSSKLAANKHDSVPAVAGRNDDRDPKEKTYPCKVCGRHFIKSSLVKHEPACKKLTKMHRKIFDSGRQRAANSDIPLTSVRKAAKEKEKLGGIFPRPQTHWRERHQEFIGAVSASRQVDLALKTGAPLPPPPKTSVHPDYVRCDYCGRSFNRNAAERHIPFCREKNGRQRPAMSRSSSVGRVPTTKSQPSRSEHRHDAQPKTPQRQRSGAKSPGARIPTGIPVANGRSANQANSATQHRSSGLPTPTRSRSAPRSNTAASRSSSAKSGKSRESTPRQTRSANKPRTPSKAPKSPGKPRTASKPKTAESKPKTPKADGTKPKTPKAEVNKPKTPKEDAKTGVVPHKSESMFGFLKFFDSKPKDNVESRTKAPDANKGGSEATNMAIMHNMTKGTPRSPAKTGATPKSPAKTVATPKKPSKTAVTPKSPAKTVVAPKSPAKTVATPKTPTKTIVHTKSPPISPKTSALLTGVEGFAVAAPLNTMPRSKSPKRRPKPSTKASYQIERIRARAS